MFTISDKVGIERLKEISEILNRPFPEDQIKVRDGAYDKATGGKKQLSYVGTERVIERLNEAFGMQWTSEILSEIVHPFEVVCKVRIKANINGTMWSHDAYGGKDVVLTDIKEWVNGQSQKTGQKRPLSLADDSKAAFSDALKVAAKQFGIALHLYIDKPGQTQQPTQQSKQNAYMQYPQQQGYTQYPQQQGYTQYPQQQGYTQYAQPQTGNVSYTQPQQNYGAYQGVPAQQTQYQPAPVPQYNPQPPFPAQPTYSQPQFPPQPVASVQVPQTQVVNTPQPVNAAQVLAQVEQTVQSIQQEEVTNMG